MNSTSPRVASIALGLLLALACSGEPPPDGVRLVERARFGIVDRETPPPDSELSDWVTLPDHWIRTRPGESGIGWYRMTLEQPEPAHGSWGLFVPSSSSSFDVFANGRHLGPEPTNGAHDLQNWNRPEYFALPDPLPHEGKLTIDLRLWAREGNYRGLGAVEVGPAQQLRPRYRSARFWEVETQHFWMLLGATLALFAAGLWASTGRSPLYACFVWFAAAWLTPTVVQSLTRAPGSFWLGQWLIHVGIQQMAVSAIFLAHRVVGVARPRLEHTILAGSGIAAAALGLAAAFAPRDFDPLATALHFVGFTASLYIPVLFVRQRERLERIERAVLVACALLLLVAAGHDLAAQVASNAWHRARLLQHVAPVILMVFFAVLVSRFLALYRRAAQQNEELERRIREKTSELEGRYLQLGDLRRERVLADERSRMMREMHDGMGAQLVSLLSVVESGSAERSVLAAAIRESIDELRLVIHSLEPSGGELGTLLALLRERLSPRVSHAGLRFEWQIETTGDDVDLSPERALNVVRIVEEATTNVLKHADASTLKIATRRDNRSECPGTVITISDDGVGIGPADATRAGRGLANMQRRSAALGGSLQVTATGEGTRVELWLPEDG